MKKIIVLGPGCPRCEALATAVAEAAERAGVAYELEKITDITRFPSYGLLMTPGLVVDGQLKIQGKVPSVDELTTLLA